jgi:hypothetical protein
MTSIGWKTQNTHARITCILTCMLLVFGLLGWGFAPAHPKGCKGHSLAYTSRHGLSPCPAHSSKEITQPLDFRVGSGASASISRSPFHTMRKLPFLHRGDRNTDDKSSTPLDLNTIKSVATPRDELAKTFRSRSSTETGNDSLDVLETPSR